MALQVNIMHWIDTTYHNSALDTVKVGAVWGHWGQGLADGCDLGQSQCPCMGVCSLPAMWRMRAVLAILCMAILLWDESYAAVEECYCIDSDSQSVEHDDASGAYRTLVSQ